MEIYTPAFPLDGRCLWEDGWSRKIVTEKTLGHSALNFEQLRTVLVEVENIVNSRPITFVGMSCGDSDSEILTPQKFLTVGRRENLPIIAESDPQDPDFEAKITNKTAVVHSWKIGQFYLNRFWEMWHKGYLLSLREHHASDKFQKIKSEIFRPPRVDEIVLI